MFNYITTLWRGNLVMTPAMLFSIGLVVRSSPVVSTGSSGPTARWTSTCTTPFVVAHFHIVMGMSAIFGMFAGIYHWFPKMYGRMMNTRLGYAHFWLTFISAFGVFFPMHYIGLAGAPRRYYEYSSFLDSVMDLNVLVTVFAIIGGMAQLIRILTTSSTASSVAQGRAEPVEEQHPGVDHRWNMCTATGRTASRGVPLALRLQQARQGHDYVPQTVPIEDGEEEH